MRATSLRLARIVALATCFMLAIYPAASGDDPVDPLRELSKHSNVTIRTESDDRLSIEFCPDSVCDLFVANGETTLDDLGDFAFIYIYHFSKSYLMQEWQNSEEPARVARQILSKDRYQGCKRETEAKTAHCVLRRLVGENRITYYSVRYDEERNVAEFDIFENRFVPRSDPN